MWDDDKMPVDADGNVADVIMDGGGVVNRLITARPFEIDINASFARTQKQIIASINADSSRENYQRNFDWLCGAYEIISPRFAAKARTRDPVAHINSAVMRSPEGIHIQIPTDNPVRIDEAIEKLLERYPKCHGKLLLTLDDGRKVLSDRPGTIGKQYMIILEKTGDEYSAVSSPVLQSQGVPGKLTKGDKQSSPGRPQATRITGETEGRILNSLVGHDTLFELLDIANSPTTHRAVCRELLTHPTPTNIDRIVDREKYPRGNNRIVGIGNDGSLSSRPGQEYVEYAPEDGETYDVPSGNFYACYENTWQNYMIAQRGTKLYKIDPEQSIGKFMGDPPRRYEAAKGPAKLEGCIFVDPFRGGASRRNAQQRR